MKIQLLAVVSVVAIYLTACQNMQPSQSSETLKHQAIEQQEVTFASPVLQEIEAQPVLNSPVKTTTNNMTLSEQLEQYNWQLTNAVDSKKQTITVLTQNKKPVALNFYTENVEGKIYHKASFDVGCNSMSGDYQLNDTQLSVSAVMGTEMYCGDNDSAESKLAILMSDKSKVGLNQQILTQTTANGSTLIWQGTLTDEAKYGKAETIFLDVDPNMEHCSSGINQQCLKVRDVYYNDNWTQSGYSEWRLMKQPIEGYNHNPKTSNRLRVKKYITNPVDVKGKQVVYVLDMVVRTEEVK